MDVRFAIDSLRSAVQAIEGCQHQERVLGHVLSFARLLRSNAVLSNALRDIADDEMARDVARLDAIEADLVAGADEAFRYLSRAYRSPGPFKNYVDNSLKRVVRQLEQEMLPEFLARVSPIGGGIEHAPNVDSADLAAFAATAADIHDRLPAVPELQGVRAKLYELQSTGTGCKRLHDFRKRCISGSLTAIAQRAESLLDDWEMLLRGGPSDESWIVPDTNGLEHDVGTLASRLELFLDGKRSRRLVLNRAKAYFEHFFCEDARELIEAEEARVEQPTNSLQDRRKKPKARRELTLRRHLDRFIFQEGFFPVTEASAKRGNLDLLLNDARRAGARPLVAEVKQVVRIASNKIGRKDVESAIRAARSEVQQYAGFLRANEAWQHIEPVVIVFHTSTENVVELETEDVILIDIGPLSPSRVRATVASMVTSDTAD